MLAFKYRFHGHGSLRYVYSNGKAVRSRIITLKYSTHPKRKNPRVAVVVSKKVLKSAVGRNRIRRRIYEVVRHEMSSIHPDRDIVLIVFSSEVVSMPATELIQTVKQLFEPAGLYKNESKNGIIEKITNTREVE